MGRLTKIEELAVSGLPQYANLRLIPRGRPRFLDPQLDQGQVRFAVRRGFNFTGILPDNSAMLSEDAFRDGRRVAMVSRPRWITLGSLIRIGPSAAVGELQLVSDLLDMTSLETGQPLVTSYRITSVPRPVVSLVGTPCKVYGDVAPPDDKKAFLLESYHPIVPGDQLLLSPTPEVLPSFAYYDVDVANPQGTRPGNTAIGEPSVVFRFYVRLSTTTGLLPFVPTSGTRAFLRAQPLYYRETLIDVPSNVGPFLIDAFSGGMLASSPTTTTIGLKTFDSFGQQLDSSVLEQPWKKLESTNHLILERPISSDSLLFWQRVQGNFQYVKKGFFQAELDGQGRFQMTSDLLVPQWPSDRTYGWVIPLLARSPIKVVVQFEPQEQQVFTIPSSVLTFIRPKVFADIAKKPIERMVIAIEGSPNSRVEIRDWQFDGTTVTSLHYYLLGGGDIYGVNRWMAGALSAKPLFFNVASTLQGRYSDGRTRYNSGYLYS